MWENFSLFAIYFAQVFFTPDETSFSAYMYGKGFKNKSDNLCQSNKRFGQLAKQANLSPKRSS
jgi:hypothetical protein